VKEQLLRVLFPEGLTQGNLQVFVNALAPKEESVIKTEAKEKKGFRLPKGLSGNTAGRPYCLDRADRAWEGDKYLLINFASKQVREHYSGYEKTIGGKTYYVLTKKNENTPFRDEALRRADAAWKTNKRIDRKWAHRDVRRKYVCYMDGHNYVLVSLREQYDF
jgi:hypothetical protein